MTERPTSGPPVGDSVTLRRAAEVLRSRSTKPKGIWLSALCRVLTDTADKIDAESATGGPKDA